MSARTVVVLRGGLGNQMFQYAAGRVVEERTGARLLLDATVIGAESIRSYELDRLGVDVEVTIDDSADAVALATDQEQLAAYVAKTHGGQLIVETAHEFHGELAKAAAGTALYGYWQSERYFDAISPAVRAELTPRDLGPDAAAHADAIADSAAPVAIHVRRGDYAQDPLKRANHGLMGADYYYKASEAIANRVVDPEFFVFSDDPDWCESDLRLAGPMHIVSGATSTVDDLGLMACCRHFAIANSSFSWWGAWLGERPGSVVAAPEQWFLGLDLDSSDMVPDRWLKL